MFQLPTLVIFRPSESAALPAETAEGQVQGGDLKMLVLENANLNLVNEPVFGHFTAICFL